MFFVHEMGGDAILRIEDAEMQNCDYLRIFGEKYGETTHFYPVGCCIRSHARVDEDSNVFEASEGLEPATNFVNALDNIVKIFGLEKLADLSSYNVVPGSGEAVDVNLVHSCLTILFLQ